MEPSSSSSAETTETYVETLPVSDNAEINRLTLELLVSKNKYNRYLAVRDPKLYEKAQQKEQKFLRYQRDIQLLTQQLLIQTGKTSCLSSDGNIFVSKRIQELFNAYMDACITHFDNLQQMTEHREEWEEHAEEREAEEEETMFAHCDSPHPIKVPASQRPKSTVPYYGLNMFMKRK
jgi:hypothetical protein